MSLVSSAPGSTCLLCFGKGGLQHPHSFTSILHLFQACGYLLGTVCVPNSTQSVILVGPREGAAINHSVNKY